MMRRFSVYILMLVLLVLNYQACAENYAVQACGNESVRLHVEGMKIVDGNGLEVPLRGIYTRTGWLERENVDWFKKWGVNFVRILLGFDEDYGQSVNGGVVDLENRCVLREENLRRTDERLQWLERAGIYYIVEIHWRALGLNDELEEPELLAGQFSRFYQQVARRYRNLNYLVGYNTFSEIYIKPELYGDYNRIRLAIIDAVRQVDPHRIISLTGVQTSSPDSLIDAVRLERENVIYDFHYYHPKMFTHYRDYYGDLRYPGWIADGWDEGVQLVDRDYLVKKLTPALEFAKRWQVPLWCGEYGAFGDAPDNSSVRWEKDMARIFAEHNIPWIFWRWKPGRTTVPGYWQQLWQGALDENTVTVVPHGGPFVGRTQVQIQGLEDDSVIRYTLDGREPSGNSILYEGPFDIEKNTTVRARMFNDNVRSTSVDVASFYQLPMFEPVLFDKVEPGLRYFCYEITPEQKDDFSCLKPVAEGVADEVDLSVVSRANGIGLIFEGYLEISHEGMYYFYSSDAGHSRLIIDGEVVVDNPLSRWISRRSGYAALRAGMHRLRLEYCRADESEIFYSMSRRHEWLLFEYEGPGLSRQVIPGSVLYHEVQSQQE